MAPRICNYKPKLCEVCGQTYIPVSSHQRYCKKCAPPTFDKAAYNRFWTKLNPERARAFKSRCYREKIKDPKYIPRQNRFRRERREKIQKMWGIVGGLKGTWVNRHWENAEEISLRILESEGYNHPIRLNYFPTCPFDVTAAKNGIQYVFQITMRTHCDDLKRHIKLADDLGLKYQVVYIKPDLTGYVIKDTKKRGVDELTLEDIKEVKRIENSVG